MSAAPSIDRALARASGIAQRISPQVAALVAEAEALPLDVRRSAVAVQEGLDLLRHCLRMATLQQAIDGPHPVADRRKRKAGK